MNALWFKVWTIVGLTLLGVAIWLLGSAVWCPLTNNLSDCGGIGGVLLKVFGTIACMVVGLGIFKSLAKDTKNRANH